MRLVLMLTALLTSFAYADGGIVKCTDANGKVSFGDAACGASAQSEAVTVKPNVVSGARTDNTYGAGSGRSSFDPELARKLKECEKYLDQFNSAKKVSKEEARRVWKLFNDQCS